MPEKSSKKRGRYLYAVISGPDERTYGDFGIEGATVYVISDGSVAAIVSDVPNKKIRPERLHLAAHQEVLRRLMEEITPLPMTFGIIADGPEAIQRILSRNQQVLVDQLHRVSGKAEMGLRVTWDVPNNVSPHRKIRLNSGECSTESSTRTGKAILKGLRRSYPRIALRSKGTGAATNER
jgi:hypothetical protein